MTHPRTGTTYTHPDEVEREDNMVVIVPYKGERYRVDFSQYNDDYQVLPRELKRIIVLEDLKQRFGEEERVQNMTVQQREQDSKIHGIRERLRAKLQAKNPFKRLKE